MQLTRWTSADTANQAPKATSPISDSWRTTSKTLSIRPNWLSLPRSPDSLPAADLRFASRAVHVRNYSPTIFFFLLGSVRTQQRLLVEVEGLFRALPLPFLLSGHITRTWLLSRPDKRLLGFGHRRGYCQLPARARTLRNIRDRRGNLSSTRNGLSTDRA